MVINISFVFFVGFNFELECSIISLLGFSLIVGKWNRRVFAIILDRWSTGTGNNIQKHRDYTSFLMEVGYLSKTKGKGKNRGRGIHKLLRTQVPASLEAKEIAPRYLQK
ncbi:hypothetical protein RCL_jg10826.t1 [Rhizophagus clarus]|uniref:Uncharacterized protein n=1 Tax=Rhizophagus clarus TaxID=94130 RepID=A0A8H3L2Y1_9GLOM|nr:hypothetical protein RCL_jg10826.t1 [Rhizophagus clarus]